MSSAPSSQPSGPRWRSSLSRPKRQQPATAVSIVFAQPEPGARLGSAIDRLPAVPVDDSASIMSDSYRKRERLNSNASSLMSRVAPRNDQVTPREGGGVARKRSKHASDIRSEPHENSDLSQNGATTWDSQDAGSASNPVDLTESPKPMGVVLEPCSDKPTSPIAGGPKASLASQLQPSQATAPTAPVPFPATDPQGTVRASKSALSRSSWFGFSRAKGTDDASSTTQLEAEAVLSGPLPVTTTASPDSGQGQSESTEDNLSATGTVASVDLSSSPASQPTVATSPPRSIPLPSKQPTPLAFSPVQYSPPNQLLKSNTTSISSVDEEVPRPRFTNMNNSPSVLSTQAVVEAQDSKTADRKPSITSLNPTTSRFTLRLPLLGRPKVPLDKAVASAQVEDNAQAEDIRDSTSSFERLETQTVTTTQARSQEPPAMVENETAPQIIKVVPPTPDLHPPELSGSESSRDGAGELEVKDSSGSASVGRSASWWDYIGWSGNSTEEQDNPPRHQQHTTHAAVYPNDAPTPASSVTNLESSPSAERPLSEGSTTPVQVSTVESQDASTSQVAKLAEKPVSVFSADTAKSQGSAWYSPWAWYGSSAHASDANAAETSSAGSADAQKTESEIVKEEALARDQEQQQIAQSVVTPKPVNVSDEYPTPEPSNPIQSSLTENRSYWMSFFVSKAATMKTITNEASERTTDGMEVMEVDDEPQSSVAIEVPTRTDVQNAATLPKPLSLLSSSSKPSSPTLPATPKSPSMPPKEREPRKQEPPAPPLTDSDSIKKETARGTRTPSPTPSKSSKTSTPPNSANPSAPNLVLPTWADTFHTLPRSHPPPRSSNTKSKLTGALSYVAGALFSGENARSKGKGKGKGKDREHFGTWSAIAGAPPGASTSGEFLTFGQELPKALDVVGEQLNPYILNGGCRVVVIGVAGWSPGAVTRTLAGGLPSSSNKFVNMTVQALEQFAEEHEFKFKKITPMPLEGDGTIRKKVSRVYNHLIGNEDWMEDLQAADVIFVASHSQGAVVSTHLIDRLIEDGHILTSRSVDTLAKAAISLAAGGAAAVPTAQAQKVCLLALCGVHLGPLRYLKTSSLLQPYFQYVENASARELFEFQDTESNVSKNYIGALRNILDHGSKVVYIASLNDQVVPIYSGLFTAASHPRILRALYIDSDAYHSSDFLSNLLILLIRVMNAGLSDRGLLAHLSEATAGTLSGVGHSTAYEEPATYSLAVKYFFMTKDGTNSDAELVINPFNAVEEQNDYEIPWLLRDMIADTKVTHCFAREFAQLRDAFDDWQPKTTILRDVKKKLQPITRLSSTATLTSSSMSKL